jgi:hypothetical protein
LGQYDTYPVRNSSGYIEYLTKQEIENLAEMGELGDVLSDRPSKRPPFAKNPANQDAVNELFYKEQAEKQRKRDAKLPMAAAALAALTDAQVTPWKVELSTAIHHYLVREKMGQRRSSMILGLLTWTIRAMVMPLLRTVNSSISVVRVNQIP